MFGVLTPLNCLNHGFTDNLNSSLNPVMAFTFTALRLKLREK